MKGNSMEELIFGNYGKGRGIGIGVEKPWAWR
jgi:hypothetical protein